MVLHEEAWTTLASAAPGRQRRILHALEQLKGDPFRAGDFEELDHGGRANQVLLSDDWLITFWSDHAVGEVRVVRLEQVMDE